MLSERAARQNPYRSTRGTGANSGAPNSGLCPHTFWHAPRGIVQNLAIYSINSIQSWLSNYWLRQSYRLHKKWTAGLVHAAGSRARPTRGMRTGVYGTLA